MGTTDGKKLGQGGACCCGGCVVLDVGSALIFERSTPFDAVVFWRCSSFVDAMAVQKVQALLDAVPSTCVLDRVTTQLLTDLLILTPSFSRGAF